ncbi:MAG: hypothetical protein H6633_06340 [Anaerolineales bacterium]|nr:hypothetical protein [Anaerolineales bacterium]
MLTLHLGEDDINAPLQAEDGINRLVELGLVRLETENAIRSHRLVIAFVCDVLGDKVNKGRQTVEITIDKEATRINKIGNPALLVAWQSHLRFVANVALRREDLSAAKLCNELGLHLAQAGDFPESKLYFEAALAIRREKLVKNIQTQLKVMTV